MNSKPGYGAVCRALDPTHPTPVPLIPNRLAPPDAFGDPVAVGHSTEETDMDAPQSTSTASPAGSRKVLAGGLAIVGLMALVKLVLPLATTGLFGCSFLVAVLCSLA